MSMIINVQLASLIYCSNIYALGIGIQSSSERLLLHELGLTESLNSFSVQFLNIRKLNEMVCLNSHFFVTMKSLLKSRNNIYLANPCSENVIFAASLVNRLYNSVRN
jgi:hypothetical protein